MKDLGQTLVRREAFSEIVIGNTAVVRAMVESGVRSVSAYPGSPTPEIADAIAAIPAEKRPFRFEFSTNEKVALELGFGAARSGRLSAVFFKSVGLNVAADSFVQLPLLDIPGGLVIILGDDPGANSSQNEQDNRHYSRMSYMPVLEPADAQEAYTMFKTAARLAARHRTAVILRLTTHVCHAKAKVAFSALPPEAPEPAWGFYPERENYIPLASTVFPLKRRALERLAAIEEDPEARGTNLVAGSGSSRGVITAGTAYLSLLDALEESRPGSRRPDVLKLGLVNPLPRRAVRDFLRAHEEVKVLEELDPVLETEIKALAYDEGLTTRILGKRDIEDRMGECVPATVRDILAGTWPDLFAGPRPAPLPAAASPRPPQLCPGCGHRSAFYAIKKALSPEDVTVADIGCHTLGYLPPYRMGGVLLSMGHSTATASGLSLFREHRRVVCFLGDSTFFHAGLPGIVNAVYNGHEVLLVVMENGTTAMTGHQDHPGTGKSFNGPAPKLPVRAALEGLGVKNIREVDTYRQEELTSMVREALAEPGFKVIIARHPCMLKLTRDARRRAGAAWKVRQVRVDPGTCVKNHECIERFACPSFQARAGGAVEVSRDLCIGDGSCRQTCPAGALVQDKEEGR
ncbi:MAG: indolepyruvate ferredoxin oxidoreductase [Treponema sp.]|nr:indolepyruvate ferredoxin oxidoreductase [Treponema sp.]